MNKWIACKSPECQGIEKYHGEGRWEYNGRKDMEVEVIENGQGKEEGRKEGRTRPERKERNGNDSFCTWMLVCSAKIFFKSLLENLMKSYFCHFELQSTPFCLLNSHQTQAHKSLVLNLSEWKWWIHVSVFRLFNIWLKNK